MNLVRTLLHITNWTFLMSRKLKMLLPLFSSIKSRTVEFFTPVENCCWVTQLFSMSSLFYYLIDFKTFLFALLVSSTFSSLKQDPSKASTTDSAQSPEVTSKTVTRDEDVNDSDKSLTEKLSAALVNVSAKDDLVKQHAKVAEEAVAGTFRP